MKRLFAFILVISLFLGIQNVFAESNYMTEGTDTEITFTVDGYAEISFLNANWTDHFGLSSSDISYYKYTAKPDEVYYLITVKVLNTMLNTHNFRNDFGEVVCDYDIGYQFNGFVEELSEKGNLTMAEGIGQSTDVEPLHEKKFYIAVALPKIVQEKDNAPLSITFSIGDSKFVVESDNRAEKRVKITHTIEAGDAEPEDGAVCVEVEQLYGDPNGLDALEVLAVWKVELHEGENVVSGGEAPEGFMFTYQNEKTVYVDADGIPSENPVVFYLDRFGNP